MVQVVENRTDLDGFIISCSPHPTLEAFDVLTVDVRQASPVTGFADLLSQRVGSQIEITVRRQLLAGDNITGATIHCRAFLAGPGVVMAEPDPAPDSFTVTRAQLG